MNNSPKIAIVAAQFNPQIVDAMVEAALDELRGSGQSSFPVIRVPGSYELPLVADVLLRRDDVTSVVVLGYIERGETLHGEVMGHIVARALVESSLRHAKPIGLGIIGPGATASQAETRKDGSARAAVRAVLATSRALASVAAMSRQES